MGTKRGQSVKISWKTFAPRAVWLVLYLIPVPAGLQPNQWHYFAIFAAVIAGLILESMPVGAIGLIGLTLAGISGYVEQDPNKALRWMLGGISESTVWLIVGAFVFSIGYRKTGLGRRLALLLVRSLGRRTLGLGYAVALSDVVLEPATPSNTARSGGTIYPIVNNIPRIYGSEPGPTAGKIGTYVMWTAFASEIGAAPDALARACRRYEVRRRGHTHHACEVLRPRHDLAVAIHDAGAPAGSEALPQDTGHALGQQAEIEEIDDASVDHDRAGDREHGPLRDRAGEDVRHDGLPGPDDLLVARDGLARQRRTERDARVGNLLAGEIACKHVDAEDLAHAPRLLIEAHKVPFGKTLRGRERLQGRLQAGEIAVDGQRELARIEEELQNDAR